MISRVSMSWKLVLAVALVHYSVALDSATNSRPADDKEILHPGDGQSMARIRGTDLDLGLDLDATSEEIAPSASALISDGLQFRMPGLFAFNGGKPFSLEKDPITGKIDFEKAPLKTLNYTVGNSNATDYDEYDEESYVTDVQSDDIYDKKNIDRKDGSVDGTRPNEINPYSPSFHDFLNLPVHYSSGKYSKEKYPLISSSYANTKVQSGLNSYNTYNHRPYVDPETTIRPPLYFTTHKTYLPKTTNDSPGTQRPTTTWSTSSPSSTTTTKMTTTTTTTTTQRPSTTVPSTQKTTSATWKPTTYSPKSSTTHSSIKPSFTTERSEDDGSAGIYDEGFESFKPMPDIGYGKKPVSSNFPVSQNSHGRPVVSEEYEDGYEYDSFEEGSFEEHNEKLQTSYPTSTVTPSTSLRTISFTSTPGEMENQDSSEQGKIKEQPVRKEGTNNSSTNLAKQPNIDHLHTSSTGPPPTSLPLGDNHREKPFQYYTGNPLMQNPMETTGDKTNYRKPESGNNPVRFFEHPILNNVNPDLSIDVGSRPYDNGNRHNVIRPLNVNPNGMQQVESTSSVIIPPGQDTVSFVLGNQQNVDGGHFVGSAIRESPYGSKTEGSFQPIYNIQNGEQRPTQTIVVPKKPASSVPVALASVAVNPKPIFVTGTGQSKPSLVNNVEQQTFNFNSQNRPYPPKINGVEPPSPSSPPSFANPNNPSSTLTGSAIPVRLNVAHTQSGPSDNSLNLGVRTSLTGPNHGTSAGLRPFQNDAANIKNVAVEASLNLGARPPLEGSSNIDRTQNEEVNNANRNENSHQHMQSGYVVFPGNSHQDRPVEEHVIVINEADGSVQEFSPTIKGTPPLVRPQEHEENLPKLSENLTPPDKPIDRPSGPYPPRPFDGRPRPYNYPSRPDYLRPPRLPPHSKPGPNDGSFKRPPLDSKLPNILPQFRPNAKSSHGHHGSELIGTIPAPYGPGRQTMLGRRPPPPYLQRLSPPPPPHALRLVSEGDSGFREPVGKDGTKYQESHSHGPPSSENQRFRGPGNEGQQFFNQDSGPPHKRFRIPPGSPSERFQGFPGAESDRFSEQKLRRNDETESDEVSGFERFSAEPPQIPSRPLLNRRSSADYREVSQVATLQMIQQQGGLDESVIKPNLPPPFRVKFSKDEDVLDEGANESVDDVDNKEEKRPVYVVYPVNSAVNIKDDVQNDDESVVVGTRGPHRPLPPDTLSSVEDDEENGEVVLPLLRDRPLLRPQSRPYSNSPIKSDFPYPLERPDPSLLITREKPLLVPSDKIDEERSEEVQEDNEDEDATKHDDTSINLIPYLQDYMPFPMRKTETPALAAKPSKSENPWPLGESDSRIISKPSSADSESSVYNRAPISVTLKTMQQTTVTPIAYAYTPTDDTPEYPKLGIRPSELIEIMPSQQKQDKTDQNPILPSQQPSSSSSSAPSPQNFMAPFMASVSAETPSSNGWNVVAKPDTANDRSDDSKDQEQETQTEQSEFDIENFKPQLFGGFQPIYEFPVESESASTITVIPDSAKDNEN